MNSRKPKTAFSLIELSMVITIIALFVGAIVIGGKKVYSNARIAGGKSLSSSSPVKDIAGLVLWLDAVADGSFKTSEINKSADESNISTWYDVGTQDDSVNNAVQSNSSYQPLYVRNAINGLPGVSFSSSANVGMIISNLALTDDYSIFVVFTSNVSGGNRRAMQSQSVDWLIGPQGGYIAHQAGSWVSQTVVTQMINKAYVAVAVRTPLASKFYVNQVDATANSAPITSPANLALGASGVKNEPLNGTIGEVIIYNRALPDDERKDIENYLIKKWKIS